MRKTNEQSINCVYTIIAHKNLVEVAKNGFGTEKTRWVTAANLMRRGRKLFIVFADAAKCTNLLAWSTLKGMETNLTGTKYHIGKLRGIGSLKRKKLIVASTGAPIPEKHIRPYVLCIAPDELQKNTERWNSKQR